MSTPTRKPFLSDEEIRPRLSCGALHFAKGDTRRPVKAMTAEQVRDKYEAHLAKREALIQLLVDAGNETNALFTNCRKRVERDGSLNHGPTCRSSVPAERTDPKQ